MSVFTTKYIKTVRYTIPPLDHRDDGGEALGVAEDGEEIVEEDALLGEVRVRSELGLDKRQPRVALVVLGAGHDFNYVSLSLYDPRLKTCVM